MPRHVQRISRADFIAAHPRCCYCNGRHATAEIDHAPARIAFIKKQGPDGFEFPSCSECNRSTALSEQVAAFYIRAFDLQNAPIDPPEFDKLVSGISNNAPEALPKFQAQTTWHNPMLDPTGTARRTMAVPGPAKDYIRLFIHKVLYALYYKTTGRFANATNRYLIDWAQSDTEAAALMNARADAWFDKKVTGKRPNVDLGDQFKYQYGYNAQHGYFGVKMAFAQSFVFFAVIGPARELNALKPQLPLCPAISQAAHKISKRVRKL